MIRTLVHWIRRGGGLLLAPLLANANEWRVRPYMLPELPETAEVWAKEKGRILNFFEREVYGTIPKDKPSASTRILEEGEAFEGRAIRKQVALTLTRAGKNLTLQLLMYLPQKGAPHRTLLTYNLEGNHTMTDDRAVIPSRVYAKRLPGVLKRFKKRDRGRKIEKEHLPIEVLLNEGVAVVTLYYGDVDPDYDDDFKNGIHALYPELAPGSWGSISAWAWGLSCVTDYLVQYPDIEQEGVSLFGFSRLGKAALWAAANDDRFSEIIVDSPGKGGASLARRNFGETIFLMTFRFPHWFIKRYRGYAGREKELPVDQHQLLSLIAPRPVLVSSADKDWWSDPEGEQAAVEAARAAYRLYDDENHLRHMLTHGDHSVTRDEWEIYTRFLLDR